MVTTSTAMIGGGSGSGEACEEERGLQRGSELGFGASLSTARSLRSCGAVRKRPLGGHRRSARCTSCSRYLKMQEPWKIHGESACVTSARCLH